MLVTFCKRPDVAGIILLCLVLSGCAAQQSSQPTTTPQQPSTESSDSAECNGGESGSEASQQAPPSTDAQQGGSVPSTTEAGESDSEIAPSEAPAESAEASPAGMPPPGGVQSGDDGEPVGESSSASALPPVAGEPAAGLPSQGSPSGSQTGGPPAATGGSGKTGVLTSDEQRAGLDRELDASLKQFDNLIAGEQEDLAERRKETESRVAASSGGSLPVGSDGAGSGGGQSTGDSPTGGPGGQASGAPSGSRGAVPADVKDGRDDDVVARQLREAAENEKDPELREKLWQEYRDYKAGLSGKKKPKNQDAEDEKKQEDAGDG